MSDLSSDAKELMDLVKAVGETARNSRRRGMAPTSNEDEDKMPGDVTQWANIGDGYLPTTRTLKKLPAGQYGVMFFNGQPYFQKMFIRTDEIMDMPDSRSQLVIEEIRKFWNRKSKYTDFGLLYKLGVLMFGPPGSGKSITVKIIAQEMVKQGGIVLYADKHPVPVSQLLSNMRKIEPERMIVVVLEDVDALIEEHGESEYLSLLDGENQIDNVVYIATTNYPERIDPRFINRPSRFDLIVKVPMPNSASRELYLKNLIKTTTIPSKDGKLIDLVAETEGLSLAHLRELVRSIFIAEHDPEDTIARLKSMRILPKSSSQAPMGI